MKHFGKDIRFSSRGLEHEAAIVPTQLDGLFFNILLYVSLKIIFIRCYERHTYRISSFVLTLKHI
jgi:hypothetical protein